MAIRCFVRLLLPAVLLLWAPAVMLLAVPRVSATSIVSPDGWGWQNGGNTLYGVWGSSPSDIFAVGSYGTILHYDGDDWAAMDTGITDDLYAIWGSSPSDVIAVGQSGTILRYDGSLWTRANTVSCLDFTDVWGSSSTDIYAVGPGASAHFDGLSWTAQCDSRASYRNPVYGIWGTSANDIFRAGRNNMVSSAWVMRNSTVEWSWSTPPGSSLHFSAIWGSSPNDVFVIGDLGTTIHYDGTSWGLMAMPGTANLSGVWGSSPTDVFTVGSGGTIYHYDGANWLPMASGTTSGLTDVWGSSSTDVFAVGGSGAILHYDGSTWGMICGAREGTNVDLYGVWGSSSTDVFAVGQSGIILHYDGSHWSPMQSGTMNDLQSVWGTSASDVFAVGDHGTVLHYDGFAWSPMPNPFDTWLQDTWGGLTGGTGFQLHFDSLYGIWGSSAHDVFAVGGSEIWWDGMPHSRGIVMHYNGTAWDTIVADADCVLYAAWGISGEEVFVSGGCSLVGHFDGNAWSFTHLFNWTDRLFDIWGSSATDVFAVGGNQDNQHIRHYDGTTWTMVDTGSLIGFPHGVWGSSPSSVFVVNWDTALSDRSQSMFYYDGISWETMNSGTRNGLYDVWGTSAYDVFAVGSGGTILHYFDLPPSIDSISPVEGRRGETLDIVITGANLATATAVSFGEGATVNSFNVEGSTRIAASITFDKHATIGLRDVSVTTPGGTATLAEQFNVQDSPPGAPSIWIWVGIGLGALALVSILCFFWRRRTPVHQ